MDRTPFTDMMNKVDAMSDSQLTMLYVYIRDVRQMRAQERAMARRQVMNKPQDVTNEVGGTAIEKAAGVDTAPVRGVSDQHDAGSGRVVGKGG